MDVSGGIPLSNSVEFVLAAAFAVALQRHARRTSSSVSAADTMSEATSATTRPSSSGRESRSSGFSTVSTEGFIPNFSSTPFASDGTQSETLLDALNIADEADEQTDATPSAELRSRETTKASLRRRRSTQRTRERSFCEHTHDETKLTTSSERSRLYRSLRSKDYWEQEYAVQSQWIGKVITRSFSRPAVVAYVLECWKTLTKIYSSLRSRPVELQSVIYQYLVNAVKLLEFLIHRGYSEVRTLMNEFINKVLGSYLRKPGHMCELCPAWVQSREVLRIVCETPTCIDVLFGLWATVANLNAAFLKTVTADVASRDISFAAYAMDQMSDFMNRINQRMQQLQRKKSFGLLF